MDRASGDSGPARRLAGGVTGLAIALTVALGAALSTTPAPADEPYQIEMIVFRGCEEACTGFKEALDAEEIPYEIRIHDAERDVSRFPGFVEEIRARDPDLVVTWGTSTALEVFGTADDLDPERHITDIPGVFMIVSQPVASGLVPSLESSERNITGTDYLVPERVQIEAARRYLPFERIGMVYSPNERNAVINLEQLSDAADAMGLEVIDRPLPLHDDDTPRPEDIEPMVDELVEEGIDILYQGADSFLNVNQITLTRAAVDRGIPVFTNGEAPVRNAYALMGVANEYYTVGQLSALRAIDVLQGTDPADIAIEAPERFAFLVNLSVARELDLYPPMSLLRVARFVDPHAAAER